MGVLNIISASLSKLYFALSAAPDLPCISSLATCWFLFSNSICVAKSFSAFLNSLYNLLSVLLSSDVFPPDGVPIAAISAFILSTSDCNSSTVLSELSFAHSGFSPLVA